MKRLILGLMLAVATLLPSTALAAPSGKVGVCHYDSEDATYYFVNVSVKSVFNSDGSLKKGGHGGHMQRSTNPDYLGSEGTFVMGESCPKEPDEVS